MWPYVLLILIPLLVQYIRLSRTTIKLAINDQKKNRNAMIVFWVLSFGLLALRHDTVGIDLKTYDYIFHYIDKSSWQVGLTRSYEWVYSLLNKIIALFTDDFRWVIVVVAVISVLFVAIAYTKYSTDTMFTIALFIVTPNFILQFSGLRQAIAISLGFVAFEFVRKRKIGAFCLIVILAMLFHTSAFMLFFLYPLYYVKITRKWLLWVVPSMIVVFVFNKQIFGFLSLISSFTKYDFSIKSTGAYTMIIVYTLFAVFSYLVPEESELDADTFAMRNYLLMAVVLQMFAPLHSLAMRMNYYYIAFIPLLMPRIVYHRSKRWSQIAILGQYVMAVFFIIYFFITVPQENVLNTFPYHFFWENVS